MSNCPMTSWSRWLVALGTVLSIALAACGGGANAAPTSAPSQAATQSEAAPVDATQAAPSEVAGAESPPSPAAQNGPAGPSGGVCSLVTDDELAGVLGQAVKTDVIAGPPDTCDIQSTDGAPLAAINYTKVTGVSASAVYDAFAGAPNASAIGGIGEKAAFDPDQGSLVAIKNGAVLVVAVFDASSKGDTALDLMKRIATIAAGRM